MARKMITMAIIAASAATAILPASAIAQDHGGWDRSGYQDQRDGGHDRQDRQRGGEDRREYRGYDRRGDYGQGRGYGAYGNRGYYNNNGYDRSYRRDYENRGYYPNGGYGDGNYGRPRVTYRCHNDGSTGAIIGALAGGLLGNGIAGRGDRTLGTVLGAGGGALAGRAIERSGNRC